MPELLRRAAASILGGRRGVYVGLLALVTLLLAPTIPDPVGSPPLEAHACSPYISCSYTTPCTGRLVGWACARYGYDGIAHCLFCSCLYRLDDGTMVNLNAWECDTIGAGGTDDPHFD